MAAEVAQALGRRPSEVNPHAKFRQHGLDSAWATALAGKISTRLARSFPVTLVWRYPTLDSLAAHLEKVAAGESTARAEASPGQVHRAAGRFGGADPIAVVGMACRFPGGATTPERFWDLLRQGRDAVGEVPRDPWSLDEHYDPDLAAPGKNTRWGGFLERADQFDPFFFGISPREAAQMDPQQRLALALAWEASSRTPTSSPPRFRAAGPASSWARCGATTRGCAAPARSRPGPTAPPARTPASSPAASPTRWAFAALAWWSTPPAPRRWWRCTWPARACTPGNRSWPWPVASAWSWPPGAPWRCRSSAPCRPGVDAAPYDAGADGYVRGEGGGIVVLREPLSRAIARGDTIYGIIRGTAVNNDGSSNGLTAPSPEAQEEVLRSAYECAGVATGEVQYVEAHGPGTALGDPIEAGALAAVLGAGRTAATALRIGSVKTNLGHLEAAAGVAGLIKVLLSMKHRLLPASLHFERPNPHIPFEELNLEVQRQPGPWPRAEEPLLAGVSSFGFGGTNAHAVVEGPLAPACLFPLAADSPEGLFRKVVDLMPAAAEMGSWSDLEAACRKAALSYRFLSAFLPVLFSLLTF